MPLHTGLGQDRFVTEYAKDKAVKVGLNPQFFQVLEITSNKFTTLLFITDW